MATGLESLERVEFEPGDYLFIEGEQSYHFYIIESGQVDIVLSDPKATHVEILIATLDAGQPVGEFALVTKKPRSASARARTPCTAVKISEEVYQELLKDLPEWALSLISSLIERLRRTDEMLRQSSFSDETTKTEITRILSQSES